MPLPSSCAPACQTVECLKMFLLLEGYRWDCQIMLIDVVCQSLGTNARKALYQQTQECWRLLVFLVCFSELARNCSDLLSFVPLCDVKGVGLISHCAIVCCPNHISVGQRKKCWLIIQHGSTKSPETTKSGLWQIFSVNSIMARNKVAEITQKSSFYEMKGRFLVQHFASHCWRACRAAETG